MQIIEIRETAEFRKALRDIRDQKARQKILIRIRRLGLGNPGQVEAVGEGVSELKIDCGPGYRVYYTHVGRQIVLLLTCGDKGSQDKDIRQAIALKSDYM